MAPAPDFTSVGRPALPTLARLARSSDEEVLSNTAWALAYLSNRPDERAQAAIEACVGRRLVELLVHPSRLVQQARDRHRARCFTPPHAGPMGGVTIAVAAGLCKKDALSNCV